MAARIARQAQSLGWIEGQNLVIESAFADAKVERLAALAEELVRKRVDVILAYPDTAAITAARATRTIPIVFVNASWPVEQGLIESYGRPGRNVTGVATYTGIEVSAKRLEFLKAVAPTATRLSWILSAPTEQTVDGAGFDLRPGLSQAATSLGYEVRYLPRDRPHHARSRAAEEVHLQPHRSARNSVGLQSSLSRVPLQPARSQQRATPA